MSNHEATSEHSAQPVTADQGFNRLKRTLGRKVPAHLYHAGRARQGLRALRRRG